MSTMRADAGEFHTELWFIVIVSSCVVVVVVTGIGQLSMFGRELDTYDPRVLDEDAGTSSLLVSSTRRSLSTPKMENNEDLLGSILSSQAMLHTRDLRVTRDGTIKSRTNPPSSSPNDTKIEEQPMNLTAMKPTSSLLTACPIDGQLDVYSDVEMDPDVGSSTLDEPSSDPKCEEKEVMGNSSESQVATNCDIINNSEGKQHY